MDTIRRVKAGAKKSAWGRVINLRVAIIGAGISGLACAHELERNGLRPDIFEERPRTGDPYDHIGAILQIINRPVKDPLEDLSKNHQIRLKPLNTIKKITMHAPRVTGSVYGNLGYLVLRGQTADSAENQIYSHIRTPVFYNAKIDHSLLAATHDYVVVATGNYQIAKALGLWQDLHKTWLMGATVLGAFEPSTVEMWLNTQYAESGYAYLLPFDRKSAVLVLVVSGASRDNIMYYWKKFWQIEKLSYEVAALWDLEHVSGLVYPHQWGNMLFVGNAGGFLEPFLGFGLYAGMQSGVFAARAIVEGRKYEDCLVRHKENIRISTSLRKALNRYSNEDFDRLVSVITKPVVKNLIYNTNLDMFKITASLLGLSERIRSL